MGKILWLNLTDESFKEEELSEQVYRYYIGAMV
jgi:aldehyde:ferredoxin oxidoreductase